MRLKAKFTAEEIFLKNCENIIFYICLERTVMNYMAHITTIRWIFKNLTIYEKFSIFFTSRSKINTPEINRSTHCLIS